MPKLDSRTQGIYLAKILVFQMSFPGFYMHLQLYPGNWEYLEKEIIKANTAEDREKALKARPELELFWKDPYLQAFMRKTATKTDPDPPTDRVVSQLLQITNLVTTGVEGELRKSVPEQPPLKGRGIDGEMK